MRAALAFLLLGAFWGGAAQASSFVTLEPLHTSTSQSIVTLGQPTSFADVETVQPPARLADPDVAVGEVDPPRHRLDPADSAIITISPSIIAMGEPAVADEKV